MRRIVLLSFFGGSVAMAQVSGPLVSPPTHFNRSDHVEQMARSAQVSAFAVREFRPNRNHQVDKALLVAEAARNAGNTANAGNANTNGRSLNALVATPTSSAYNQTATYQPLGAVMGANFEALGLGTPGYAISGAPPDTTLAVSPTQIVQWVNSQFAVYDKAGVPQLPAPGFLSGNTIWAALGPTSLCASTNRGDPIVQYDRLAGRWILSQFAFTSNFSNNAQCIAVSTTNNAMGSYNLYEYNFGTNLPDYGKLGVWPDAYYLTYNMFNQGQTYAGGRACAYDRAAMLAGTPAPSQICFNSTSRFSFLPADLDGTTPPPPGTPNVHISWNWAFLAAPPYTMQLTKFVPNFANPASSTFNDGFGGAPFSFVSVPLDAATVAACNDSGNNCVPQLGTSNRLDTLGDRQMYRLVYRNFGSYDALLVTQSVDAQPGSTANLRWWEIRQPSANPPEVYQNSNFIPNTDARWMGSAAFDKLGNIGVGYSASSAAMNPAIKVSGRRKTDPKNLLRTEVLVQAGGGSQTGTLTRWGDYSTMQIDPADECTFWYTTQYIGSNGTFNWRTRIASFRFPNCT